MADIVRAAEPVRVIVPNTAGGIELLPENGKRRTFTAFNEGTVTVRLKFGLVPSATSYSVQIAPLTEYTPPAGVAVSGPVWSIVDSSTAPVMVQEFVT